MSKIYTIDEMMKIRIKPLQLSSQWRMILGNLPSDEQWKMMIFGYSQSGKSSFAMKVANILSGHGLVLYNAAEEKISTGTITERMRRMNVYSKNIKIFQNEELEPLKEKLRSGEYKYCIIDSVNKLSMTQRELLEVFYLPKEFRNVSFIFINHGDKEMKNYIGPAALQNLVDVAIEMNKGDIKVVKNYYAIHAKRETNFNIFKRI